MPKLAEADVRFPSWLNAQPFGLYHDTFQQQFLNLIECRKKCRSEFGTANTMPFSKNQDKPESRKSLQQLTLSGRWNSIVNRTQGVVKLFREFEIEPNQPYRCVLAAGFLTRHFGLSATIGVYWDGQLVTVTETCDAIQSNLDVELKSQNKIGALEIRFVVSSESARIQSPDFDAFLNGFVVSKLVVGTSNALKNKGVLPKSGQTNGVDLFAQFHKSGMSFIADVAGAEHSLTLTKHFEAKNVTAFLSNQSGLRDADQKIEPDQKPTTDQAIQALIDNEFFEDELNLKTG